MPADLTARYIAATVANLPAASRRDVHDELSASIADAIDARTEQGEERSTAEREVLTELGDPGVLAAQYTERPLHLIGPRYYLTWRRLLKTLLLIVPIVAMVAIAAIQSVTAAPLTDIIAETLSLGISSAIHVFFWVTIVFLVLERTQSGTGTAWDVDQLPEAPENGAGPADVIASAVFAILLLAALAGDTMYGLVRTPEGSFSLLHPGLWPAWSLVLAVLLVLEVALAVAVFLRGRWTTAFAVVNTALSVAFLSWALTLLGNGRLLNPAALEALNALEWVSPGVERIALATLVVTVIAVSIWDIVDGWRKARRAQLA